MLYPAQVLILRLGAERFVIGPQLAEFSFSEFPANLGLYKLILKFTNFLALMLNLILKIRYYFLIRNLNFFLLF
jgi:hypothetical protein